LDNCIETGEGLELYGGTFLRVRFIGQQRGSTLESAYLEGEVIDDDPDCETRLDDDQWELVEEWFEEYSE